MTRMGTCSGGVYRLDFRRGDVVARVLVHHQAATRTEGDHHLLHALGHQRLSLCVCVCRVVKSENGWAGRMREMRTAMTASSSVLTDKPVRASASPSFGPMHVMARHQAEHSKHMYNMRGWVLYNITIYNNRLVEKGRAHRRTQNIRIFEEFLGEIGLRWSRRQHRHHLFRTHE
jgi:hypothetical protein